MTPVEQTNPYKQYCTPDKLKRQTWYGDTYGAEIAVGGSVPVPCDVTHIRLPFLEEREAEAATAFNLAKSDMDGFYKWLWERIRNHVSVTLALWKDEKLRPNIIRLLKADTVNEDGAKDVYLITPPCEPFFDPAKRPFISLPELCGFGVKLGNIIRDVGACGYAHGGITPSALYMAEDGRLALGDFFFAAKLKAEPPEGTESGETETTETDENPYRYFQPPHVPETALTDGERSPAADARALISVLLSVLTGTPLWTRTPYMTVCTLFPGSGTSPVPEKLSGILRQALASDDPLAVYRKTMNKYLNECSKDAALSGLSYRLSSFHARYVPVSQKGLTETELMEQIVNLSEQTDTQTELIDNQPQTQ